MCKMSINICNFNIEVILNNNPPCETTLESISKQEIWNMKNEPFILIKGNNFKNGAVKVIVSYNEKQLINKSILIVNNLFQLKIQLKQPLINPKQIKITINNEAFIIPIELKKLYGTVKYFNGNAVKNPIIHCTNSGIMAIGDEEGNFELILSSKETQIGVFDKSYSKETLESWIYNVNLNKDTKLDIKIGKAEVYGINVWHQYTSDYMHFIPMSLTKVNEAIKNGAKDELEIASYIDKLPKLNKKDIKVYSNENIADILSFSEVDDFLGYKNGQPISRAGYVVSIPKETNVERIIKIEVNSNFKVDKKLIEDRGEGYYIVKK
ncbi:hypothetical protein CLOACE_19190 [Clostridium acetireducens DSM 10703]|uniref:Uncharacterized protein n=1 Tax=Clostridium acetireducens DSM 10703 TaxID=1121290 RepID=A0A1E8EWN7_9CLOT|nr:hypothetical protein [Clostridium acetireducens]OFI05045.1 hypothetical protein CLOACE_19190 [Clostridium acetireducens DSM 10703]